MDTTSHIVVGLGLGMLAQLDPNVANSSSLANAVLLGTVMGSNVPDLDFAYKLKGNGSYFRNHRGWSHSLPALPLWGLIVASGIYLFFPDISFLQLFLWTLIAVILHVFMDLFNVYGTQAALPFSNKWISFDSIPLFDPFIVFLHGVGFVFLPFFSSGLVFLFVYIIMLLYIALRTIISISIRKHLLIFFQNAQNIKLIPYTSLWSWGVLIETNDDFLFGVYSRGKIEIEHTLSKRTEFPKLIMDTLSEQPIADFLSSTNYAYPFVIVKKNGYFVYWKDLRFRKYKSFPCLTITFISQDLKSKSSYIGWLRSSKHYKRIVRDLEKTPASSSITNL